MPWPATARRQWRPAARTTTPSRSTFHACWTRSPSCSRTGTPELPAGQAHVIARGTSTMPPSASPAPREDRLKLALLTHIRQDFSAPVGAILGYAEILMEDAPRYSLEHFTPDLAKMYEAGLTLQHLIDELLDPRELTERAGGADFDALGTKLRHDLRTPLNAIQGYGEMLLEEAEPEPEIFVQDLKKLLNASKRLLARIDALVDFAKRDSDATAAIGFDGGAPVLDALHRMARPAADPEGRLAMGCRILVVDDHEANRDLLSRRLMRERREVVTAASCDEALKLIDEQPFDLILLDLLMPGISGYEVLQRLKSEQRHRDVSVIMISALDQIDSVAPCIEAGAEDYMPKPFNPVLLRARINACIEKKRLRDRERIIMQQLRIEKEKSEALLLNILPRLIVSRLNQGETVIADHVADATILFADLVGFTNLSAQLSATRLVHLLNLLFSEFDRLSAELGLAKIKTIGDASMVAGGLLEPRADHVEAVAEMGLAMVDVSRLMRDRLDLPLRIR